MKEIQLFAVVAGLGLGIASGVDSLNIIHANDTPVITHNKSTYTVTVPSEININASGNSGSFDISGELHKRYWMDLNITSTNAFNMKNVKTSSKGLKYSL